MNPLNARQRILSKLRAAHVAAKELPDVASFYAQTSEDHQTLVERTILNLKNAMAEVYRTTADHLVETVSNICREKGLESLAVGLELLEDKKLCDGLGLTTQLVEVIANLQDPAVLFNQVSAGLTLTHGAIAETGTLVVWSSDKSPRLLSLVPPVHLAIVYASRVKGTLVEMMTNEDWAEGLPTNVILISSPSKTADIQQTLAYGAHGPKELIVLMVEDR